jgi:hypothetical protein
VVGPVQEVIENSRSTKKALSIGIVDEIEKYYH